MKTIINKSTDPYYNLSLEEYLLKNWQDEEELFYLWRNSPALIIGRNQNVFEEINLREVESEDLPVIGRISGGGTVYHDLGNLNFSFIVPYEKESLNNYKKFTKPIIKVLNDLGIPAEFYGKSDIRIGEKKISGNAQSYYQSLMIHHGTLLFDTDLDKMRKFLKTKNKFLSTSVRSNPSATINIKEYLPIEFEINDLIKEFIVKIGGSKIRHHQLNTKEQREIELLRAEKYLSWDWNFGESPEFRLESSEPISLTLKVKAGYIEYIDFYISELTSKDCQVLKEALIGKRFVEKELSKILARFLLEENIKQEFLNSLFE